MSDQPTDLPERLPDPLFIGDRGRLTAEGRRALVLLLKSTHLAVARHPVEWEALLLERERIEEVLHELFLLLVLDQAAGVAYKTQARPEGGQAYYTLLNQQPLQAGELRLLLHLRELLRDGAVAGEREVTVRGQDLLDHLAQSYQAHQGDHVRAREQDKKSLRSLASADIIVPRRGTAAEDPEHVVYTVSGIVESIVTPDRARAFAAALRGELEPEDPDDAEPGAEDPGPDQDALFDDDAPPAGPTHPADDEDEQAEDARLGTEERA